MKKVKLLIFFTVVSFELDKADGLKVYNFEGTLNAGNDDNKTMATLTNPIEEFTQGKSFGFCFSFKLGKTDRWAGPVEILDKHGNGWLSFFFLGEYLHCHECNLV